METEYETLIKEIGTGVPDARQYKHLSSLTVISLGAEMLRGLDPFSAEYAKAAFELYKTIRGGERADYLPARDEAAPSPLPASLFTDLVPWSFRDAGLVAEFLVSWGHMLQMLEASAGSQLSVLEYGTGSGQFLLILARLGFAVHGVDINADAVEAVQAQAARMGLTVHMQQAEFGGGFEGQRFDRIVFFEAFHHAFDFMTLLRQLRDRLNPGGMLILCGEPVVSEPSPSIPYPWGPRLDGLSAFCIRRFGWMELGFTWPFLREAMRRAGWTARFRPMPGCGRADCYVAVPADPLACGQAWRLQCGTTGSEDSLDGDGWSTAEGSHRWTVGAEALVLLPGHSGEALRIAVTVANHLAVAKPVTIRCGDQFASSVIPPATEEHTIHLARGADAVLGVEAPLDPAGGSDQRMLGIAVREVRVVVLAG